MGCGLRATERPFITIIDELNKFIPNSEKFMSSYGKYHLNNDRYKNIYDALNDFVIEADLKYSWEELNREGNQYGDRYYKDLDQDKKND